MAERFEKLFSLPSNLYSENSPVIIAAGSLLKDTKTERVIVQLKYHSVSDKLIKAIKIDILAYDVAGKEVEGVTEYQYLDLNVHNGQEFGSNKAIILPNIVTRSFAIKNISVVLFDGTTVCSTAPMNPLQNSQSLQLALKNNELVRQYQIEVNADAVVTPIDNSKIWCCSCGEWNSSKVCTKCKANKTKVFEEYNISILSEKMSVRLEKEKAEKEKQRQMEEEARLVALEEERKKKEKRAKQKTALKKGAKISAIVASVIAAIVILISLSLLFINNVVVPANKYKDAVALMESKDWQKAQELLLSLNNYKDSENLIKECKYNILRTLYDDTVSELILNEEYEKAYNRLLNNGTAEQLKYFKAVYTKSKYSCKNYRSTSEYMYDKKGNLLKDIETYTDGDKDITEYTYDENNCIIKERITESNNPSYFYETIYEYDSKEHLVEESTTFNLGKGTTGSHMYNYTYDSKGLLIKKTYKDPEEYGVSIWEYEYDSEGKLLKEIHDGSTYTYYEYDLNGNLIKEVDVYSDGDESVTEYLYDSNGYLVKEFRGYADFEHSYDSNGNLTKTVKYDDGEIEEITEYTDYIIRFSFPGI